MAPYTAEASRSEMKKQDPRRSARVIPAIPLPYSRKPQARHTNVSPQIQRASTPDKNEKTDFSLGPHNGSGESSVTGTVQDPITPESLPSAKGVGIETFEVSVVGAEEREQLVAEKSDITRQLKPPKERQSVEDDHANAGLLEEREASVPMASPNPSNRNSKAPRSLKIHQEHPLPFYPSENTSSPTSVNSGAILPPAEQHPPPPAIVQRPQTNLNGVVFGGYIDSSDSSPACTGGPDASYYHPSRSTYPPTSLPFTLSGHDYHGLESVNSVVHSAPEALPLAILSRIQTPLPHGLNPEANFHPQTPGSENSFTHRKSTFVNGESLSRAASQTSSRTQDRKPTGEISQLPIAHHSDHGQSTSRFNGLGAHSPIFSPIPNPPMPLDVEAAVSLSGYLNVHFGNRDFADYIIEIMEMNSKHPLSAIPVHSVIVARSPVLLSLISKQPDDPSVNPTGLKVLRIKIQDSFMSGHVLIHAIQYLYGAPLPNLNETLRNLRPYHPTDADTTTTSPARYSMSQALAYAAAGIFLQLPVITLHGVDNARHLLRWDTVEMALVFALDGGLAPSRHSRGVSNDLPSCPKEMWEVLDKPDHPESPTRGEFGAQFLHNVLDWLIYNFPLNFELHASASQMSGYLRLPAVIESRTSMSDPRLSRIQFGQVPLEDNAQPDFTTTLLSSILLSLPFPALKYVVEHPVLFARQPNIAHITRAVIKEREIRRLKVVTSKRAISGANAALREQIKWEEQLSFTEPINPHHPGFIVIRSKENRNTDFPTTDQ